MRINLLSTRLCQLGMALLFALLILPAARAGDITHVDNNELARLIAAGVTVVDVRTAAEWQTTGVIEGSQLLTFFDESGRYDTAAFMAELGKVSVPDEPVVFICATGGRTRPITHFLANEAGYSKVINVTEGIRAWINDGRETSPAP